MIDRLRSVAISLSVLILLGGMAFWIFTMTESGKSFVGDAFGDGALPDISFKTLQPDDRSAHYLLCPDNYCLPENTPISPTWAVPVSELYAAMIEFADQRGNIKAAKMNLADRQFDFLLTSEEKPWPDVITVRFISLGDRLSSVAIYARTPVGEPTPQEDQVAFVTEWIDQATQQFPVASLE